MKSNSLYFFIIWVIKGFIFHHKQEVVSVVIQYNFYKLVLWSIYKYKYKFYKIKTFSFEKISFYDTIAKGLQS